MAEPERRRVKENIERKGCRKRASLTLICGRGGKFHKFITCGGENISKFQP